MLAMNEALMGEMDTPHLLAALEAEGPLTPAEKVLAWRLEALMGLHADAQRQIKEMLPMFEKLQEIADNVLQNDLL